MPEIAAEAGVSVGLLYRYFESKEELYLELCESVTQSHLDELAVELSRIGDPRQRLAAGVAVFVRSLEEERWGPIVIAGWAEADLRPALRAILRRRCDQLRAFAAMFLREAIARSELAADADVESMSLAVAMLLDGVIAHQSEIGDRFDADATAQAVTGLLERTIARV